MTGDLIAGARNGCLINVANNTINITGNVTAGNYSTTATSNFNRHGILSLVTCTINVYGRVTATNGIQNHGIHVFLAGPHSVFAQVARSNNWPIDTYGMYGIVCSSPNLGTTTVCAMECGTGGLLGVSTRVLFQDSSDPLSPNYVQGYQTSGGAVLIMGDVAADYPAITNVRDAVPFNFGSQVGTCKVPNPASVAVGVPVDHTVGTAVLTAEALWGLPTEDMAVPGSIGERLKNAATVDTVGAQIAALI
jgi:hypothetical protein